MSILQNYSFGQSHYVPCEVTRCIEIKGVSMPCYVCTLTVDFLSSSNKMKYTVLHKSELIYKSWYYSSPKSLYINIIQKMVCHCKHRLICDSRKSTIIEYYSCTIEPFRGVNMVKKIKLLSIIYHLGLNNALRLCHRTRDAFEWKCYSQLT